METNEQQTQEIPEEGQRPPADPRNKLYTVISLLIFAVIYGGWQLIKDRVYFAYALYDDAFSPEDRTVILNEIGAEEIQGSLEYVSLHKNFDGDTLYVSFGIPEKIWDNEDFPENFLPFECSEPVRDERLTVYPKSEPVPDFVYGDTYGVIETPRLSILIYEHDDGYSAVFRYRSYNGNIAGAMGGSIKTPVK